MTLKFTLFGAAHAGKSTLAGLMVWKQNPEACRRQIEKTRTDLGSDFDDAQALAYLVDVSDDERRRLMKRGIDFTKTRNRDTTSQRMHIVRSPVDPALDLGEVDIIDTPGGWHLIRDQRTRAMFYSDIGVFVIEATVATSPRHSGGGEPRAMYETFGALFTWVALRPHDPLVIAVSKMDQAEFDKDVFHKAVRNISALLGNKTRRPIFVPISVNVRERTSRNVFEADPGFDWHHRGSLAAAISVAARETKVTAAPLRSNFMIVTKTIERKGIGTGFFGKTISGSFEIGQRVKVIPVKPRRGEEISYVGVVRAIEVSGTGHQQKSLNEGELGGVIFSFGASNAVESTHATVIVDETTVVASGRYVRVRMSKAERTPKWLHYASHVEMLWLGRFHQAQIFEIRRRDGELEVGAMLLSNTSIACPLTDDGSRLAFADVQIIAPGNPSHFFAAKLKSVGSVRGVRIKRRDAERLNDQLQKWPLTEHDDGLMPLDDVTLLPAMAVLSAALEVPHAPGSTTDAFEVIDSEAV